MDLQHLHNCPENRNTSLLRGLLRIIICLQEVHGKDEFFQANQTLVPQFRLFWQKKKTGRRRKHRAFLAKKGDSKHGNNSEKKKRVFFEKKGEYVKRRKEKKQRKVNQTQENLTKKEIHSKKTIRGEKQ